MFMRLFHICVAALVTFSLLTQSGCMRGPGRVVPPSINANSAGQEAIQMFDKNKDGKISGAELDAVPSLKEALPNFNPPSTVEKGVTAANVTERIKKWQESRVGKIGSITCTVKRGGKPLAGADVKFVPEKFLGSNMPVCSGTSSVDGVAILSAPLQSTDDVSGVPPGYYRVEITKSGENIPAKYNTQTIFGAEIAPDTMRRTQLIFDIK